MNPPDYCPACGYSGTLEAAGSAFIEQGEWNGKEYEDEGDVTEYRCTNTPCHYQFYVRT